MQDPKDVIERAEELCVLCEEDKAEQLVRRALEDASANLDLRTELAIILSRKGHDSKAEVMLRDIIARNPCHERAVSSLGRMLDNSLRVDEAEALFTEFLRNCPPGHTVLDDLCRLWYDEGNTEKALGAARQHIKDFPKERQAYDPLLYLLQRVEDDIASGLVDNPADSDLLTALASYFIEQYIILKRLKTLAGSTTDTALVEDVEEDLSRVIYEVRDVRKRFERLNLPLPSYLQEPMNEIERSS